MKYVFDCGDFKWRLKLVVRFNDLGWFGVVT